MFHSVPHQAHLPISLADLSASIPHLLQSFFSFFLLSYPLVFLLHFPPLILLHCLGYIPLRCIVPQRQSSHIAYLKALGAGSVGKSMSYQA